MTTAPAGWQLREAAWRGRVGSRLDAWTDRLEQQAAGGALGLVEYTNATFRSRRGFEWGRHHYLIARALERLAERVVDRLMIVTPPRHGKSELASTRFPAWYVGGNPDHQLIATSHTATLSDRFSRRVREQLEDPSYPFHGVGLKRGVRAVREWEIAGREGVYAAVAVGSSPTGKGADLLLIDDPIRKREDAESELKREKMWDWYTDDLYTRLMPGGVAGLILTRWHEDDIAGRLIDRMLKNTGERWVVIHLPAICEEEPLPYALTPGSEDWRRLFTAEDERLFGTVHGRHDPIGRAPGEALWPEWYPLERLETIRRVMVQESGERGWLSLFQGRPTGAEGNLFTASMFAKRYRELDDLRIVRLIQTVDSAFKEGSSNSYSAIATWAQVEWMNQPCIALLDIWRDRLPFDLLLDAIVDQHAKWVRLAGRPATVHIEDKASGQSALQVLSRKSFLPVMPWKPPTSSSKEARAEDALPPFRTGRVILPEDHPLLADWIEEHKRFPAGRFSDLVDTTSMAMSVLYVGEMPPPASSGELMDQYSARPPAADNASVTGGRASTGYDARRGRLLG